MSVRPDRASARGRLGRHGKHADGDAVARLDGDTDRLRVLVVDDHDVVHWGFRLMLGELTGSSAA